MIVEAMLLYVFWGLIVRSLRAGNEAMEECKDSGDTYATVMGLASFFGVWLGSAIVFAICYGLVYVAKWILS